MNEVRAQIQDEKISVFVCPSDDTWVRDTGPTMCWSIQLDRLIGLDFDFNAYGGPTEGCYWPCDKDKKVAATICNTILSIPSYRIPLVLEGEEKTSPANCCFVWLAS